jgi:hypothetical protein
MRRLLFLLIFPISLGQIQAQKPTANTFTPQVKIDPRVELMGILAHLSGLGGYDTKVFKKYIGNINRHFAKDSLHPAILHLKGLGKTSQVGYDAIAQMAVHLEYPSLKPKVKFSSTVPEQSWTKEGGEKFIPLLQQFYKDTNFDSFFQSQEGLYKVVEERFQNILNSMNFGWFESFYGKKRESHYNVFVGLLNGTFSYGPKVEYPNGEEEFFAIMANYLVDKDGLPIFDSKQMLPTVVHEFNHSYINNLIIKDSAFLKPLGEKIFKRVEYRMQKNSYYSWQTTLYESLVRAIVILYLQENNTTTKKIIEAVEEQEKIGFYWMEDLLTLLNVYRNNRNLYPTFTQFYPLIRNHFKELSTNDYTYKEYLNKLPKLITSFPFVNGATDVDPSIGEIAFFFDDIMVHAWGFDHTTLGKEHYPFAGNNNSWDPSRTRLTMNIKLTPNTIYEFVIIPEGFRNLEDYPLPEPIIFKFKTK